LPNEKAEIRLRLLGTWPLGHGFGSRLLAFLGMHGQLPPLFESALDDVERCSDRALPRSHFSSAHSEIKRTKHRVMKSKTIVLAWAIGVASLGMGCQAQNPQEQANPSNVPPQAVVSENPAVVKNITGDEYLKMKAENGAIQLLDVRTPEETAQGFIEGSVKINVNDPQFAEKSEKDLSKSLPIVVYCKAGGRSARAADILAQKGFKDVYNITGGITAWMTEGKPTVK
jgi:phage shock protein E